MNKLGNWLMCIAYNCSQRSCALSVATVVIHYTWLWTILIRPVNWQHLRRRNYERHTEMVHGWCTVQTLHDYSSSGKRLQLHFITHCIQQYNNENKLAARKSHRHLKATSRQSTSRTSHHVCPFRDSTYQTCSSSEQAAWQQCSLVCASYSACCTADTVQQQWSSVPTTSWKHMPLSASPSRHY